MDGLDARSLMAGILFLLVCLWLAFKIGTLLASRVQRFSLRSLLIAMVFTSVFIAALVQIGSYIFAGVLLLAGIVGLVVGMQR
jgi:hypothetical protein